MSHLGGPFGGCKVPPVLVVPRQPGLALRRGESGPLRAGICCPLRGRAKLLNHRVLQAAWRRALRRREHTSWQPGRRAHRGCPARFPCVPPRHPKSERIPREGETHLLVHKDEELDHGGGGVNPGLLDLPGGNLRVLSPLLPGGQDGTTPPPPSKRTIVKLTYWVCFPNSSTLKKPKQCAGKR